MVVNQALVAVAVGVLVVALASRARRRFAPARPCGPGAFVDARPPASRRRVRFGRPVRVTDDDVAAWCDDLARRVRSGSSLAAALRSASPPASLAPIVAPIGLALDRGDSVAGATRRVTASDVSVELALGVLRTCADLGGPAAQPLDRTASTLRARATDLAERQVHSAQARLSAMVLTLLPGVALALLVVTSSDIRTAVAGPAGVACLGAGTALNALGWWWMWRIIGRTP